MMPLVTVVRGVVDVPDQNFLAEQRVLAQLGPGHSARTGAHLRRYHVGETLELAPGEAHRLMRLGVVKLVGST
jgi:hypothetical protein